MHFAADKFNHLTARANTA